MSEFTSASKKATLGYKLWADLTERQRERALEVFSTESAAITRLDGNPYELMEVDGFGFRTVDAKARKLGIAEDDVNRLAASVDAAAENATGVGHCYMQDWQLISAVQYLHGVSKADAIKLIYLANKARVIVPEGGLLWRPQDLSNERTIARAIQRYQSVLTGGPGTGKTTRIGSWVEEFNGVSLCAPTGCAAKRLSQVTDREAKTMHSLISSAKWARYINDYGEEKFRPVDEPPRLDIVIDETSMVRLETLAALIRVTQGNIRFVGDVNQLPPFGAGSGWLLGDLIEAGALSVEHLEHCWRTGAQGILDGAQDVLRGRVPVSGVGLRVRPGSLTEAIQEAIRLNRTLGCRVPFITATRAERVRANDMMQAALNPDGKALVDRFGKYEYRVGDPVMHLVNDWDRGIVNGDLGEVVETDGRKKMTVMYDIGTVTYDLWKEHKDVTLAYGYTTHKSQGNQFPTLVFGTETASQSWPSKNLLYTAITRAEEDAVVICPNDTMSQIVKNTEKPRQTKLIQRLRGEING